MTVFLDTFAQAFDALDTRELAGLGEGRRDALKAALRDGLPQVRNEAWKYTPLRALERRGFAPVDAVPAGFDVAQLADIPAPRAVFVNGRFDAALSGLSAPPDGL